MLLLQIYLIISLIAGSIFVVGIMHWKIFDGGQADQLRTLISINPIMSIPVLVCVFGCLWPVLAYGIISDFVVTILKIRVRIERD